MKKILSVVEAVYEPKTEEIVEVEKVETLSEHVNVPVIEHKIDILVNEANLTDECNEMKMAVNKDDFKALFGPKSKPRKGDVLSIAGLQKKFKVKKSKKFSAKKQGKGYKLTIKTV